MLTEGGDLVVTNGVKLAVLVVSKGSVDLTEKEGASDLVGMEKFVDLMGTDDMVVTEVAVGLGTGCKRY